jgi:glycosyltransferase involved in cell wall biosynthesis
VRSTRLRIAVTADPELPVPPRLYGGIERVIHFLVEGLVARGHEVVLFAHRDSQVSCRLIPYPGTRSGSRADTIRNAATIARHVIGSEIDVIHSFGRLACLIPLAPLPLAKFMSYQRAVTERSVRWAMRLFGQTLQFTACGRHMIRGLEAAATWHVVPNGVPLDRYRASTTVEADAPLMFLGRIEAIKGTHLAIQAARLSNRRLVIAGNIPPEHQDYFDRDIRPFLDGDRIHYVGPVDDAQKNEWLGRSAALLMPILWDEPFGIVMAEALACGTPVIGLDRGSVPEIVEHGVNGFVAQDVDGLVQAINQVSGISRERCRADAELRFSDRVIVDAYESIYFDACRRVGAASSGLTRHVA